MLRRASARKWPLADIRRKYLPYVPLVAALGLLASLLEGAGIGLFIPLLALLMAEPAQVPRLLTELVALFPSGSVREQTILLGAAILGLILLKNLVVALNGCLLAALGARIGADVRNGLARTLLSVDYPFFLEHDLSRLTRIMATDSWFVVEAARSALALIPAAASLLVFSLLLAFLNLKLFVLVLLGAALVQALIYVFEQRQGRLSHDFTASSETLWQRLLTLLQAPRVVRLFGQEAREQERSEAAIERLKRSLRASSSLTAFIHPAVDAHHVDVEVADLLAQQLEERRVHQRFLVHEEAEELDRRLRPSLLLQEFAGGIVVELADDLGPRVVAGGREAVDEGLERALPHRIAGGASFLLGQVRADQVRLRLDFPEAVLAAEQVAPRFGVVHREISR